MSSEIEIVEERLKSFFEQLKTECGIFERIVYKNKNQHRRCSYFQYLLKVRRDLRLLQSTKLEEVLNSCFLVINGKKPKQKVQLLESLKRKCDSGKYNFLERLLGAARLLSRMVEPMLKAATQISKLLAQSFFMGFSLTNLALLSRFRVLIQQILLDAVFVYNTVFPISQTKQSVKITEGGVEVFRDYYPIKDQNITTLECIWETDKFVLVEKTNESECQDMFAEDVSIRASTIQYQSVEVLLRDNDSDEAEKELAAEIFDHVDKDLDCLGVSSSQNCEEKQTTVDSSSSAASLNIPESSSSPLQSNPLKRKTVSREKVAFFKVAPPAPSTAGKSTFHAELGDEVNKEKEDPFFSLLTGDNKKSSIF